jgi:hypothetical protein
MSASAIAVALVTPRTNGRFPAASEIPTAVI